jgi:hypothetical protein
MPLIGLMPENYGIEKGKNQRLLRVTPSLLRTIDKLISQPDNDSKAN